MSDETETDCGCRCHVNAGLGCDREHDTGSTGVAGAWSCSPHVLAEVEDVPLDEACVLGHDKRAKRFIGYACKRHYHWIDRTLVEIEELFAMMDDALLPGPSSEERTATRFGSPAPGSIDVMALTDKRAKTPIDLHAEDDVPDLPGSLHSWASLTFEERANERAQPLDGTVTASIRLLRRERHWIARQEWVDDYAAEIGSLHRSVARAVKTTMWPESIGACPNCRAPLYLTVGVDAVTCRKCKSSWTGKNLMRLQLILEQEANRGKTTDRPATPQATA